MNSESALPTATTLQHVLMQAAAANKMPALSSKNSPMADSEPAVPSVDHEQSVAVAVAVAARRERDESDSHYENDHVRKKASLDYHDSKTEGAYFISTTYDMINRCNREHPEIACWSPDGKTVLIRDQTAFASRILPDYFTSKYESFTRQLSFYGFRKMQARNHGKKSKKTEKCASFINDKFQRDKPELLKFIKRTTNHGVNVIKQTEEDKLYLEVQKKEVQVLKETVEKQEKEIQFLRIVQMEMKTQLSGVMQVLDLLKKDSVFCAHSLPGRRTFSDMPPTTTRPLSQQQLTGNKPIESSIQQAQMVTMQATPAPAIMEQSNLKPPPRIVSDESNKSNKKSEPNKMSTLIAAVETANKVELNPSTTDTAANTATAIPPTLNLTQSGKNTAAANQFVTFNHIPAADMRANSYIQSTPSVGGVHIPTEQWVLQHEKMGLQKQMEVPKMIPQLQGESNGIPQSNSVLINTFGQDGKNQGTSSTSQ